MFQVLTFVYENFWGGKACPELPTLHRKLNSMGFDSQEVVKALIWLEDLNSAAQGLHRQTANLSRLTIAPSTIDHTPGNNPSPLFEASMRVLTPAEQRCLGVSGWGLLVFLVRVGALTGDRLEMVMERAMATSDEPISLESLKLIVLMVYWSLDEALDDLVIDELCDNRLQRLAN